ncbi:hypothetical protein ERO13_D12G187500v2 [Gossypium hirsutum]|uniref:Uncharacterized protein n=3 Tax=Gossypium TaxID=3633 RepID=A0A0D2T9C8_GOSRA|nr:hypothetical protein ERO13_D12G187500v2 [Gossypium hirsutum]KJB51096.1 hypothetical protein B456_008G200900 [Gossypium raimondii]TYH40054.1 hypothetical protein ES332_D12G220000v1 [Gossypium tomentosum]TYI51944.1 hypothetical protein E1A91_D12G211200v1 [Gossypium mustelinum]
MFILHYNKLSKVFYCLSEKCLMSNPRKDQVENQQAKRNFHNFCCLKQRPRENNVNIPTIKGLYCPSDKCLMNNP